MKRKSIFRILAVLFTATIFFAACTKEDPDVKLDPKLSTAELLNVTSDGATVVGFVIAEGDGFTERGVCYNTATAPTIANSKAIYTGQTTKATFDVVMSGLAYATKYYVRAYATDANGATVYGEEFSFTTLPVVPTLATADIVDITGNSASGGGMVLVDGGAAVTVHGICYGTNPAPTIEASKTEDGNAAGPYVSVLSSLKGNTKYYVRAYATNSAGTGYGPEKSFTTEVDLPALTTAAISGLTKVSAVSGGKVTYDGGADVTARGIVWGLNANPTMADNVIAGGAGLGDFVSNIAGLTKNTTYHVRAYATNSVGTAYGADIVFTTLADILTWYVPGDYLVASYGVGGPYLDWNPAKSPILMNSADSPDILEGYVYMAKASNNWKCTSDPDWNHTNYGPGATPGTFSTDNNAGNILAAGPAYYQIKTNPTALTYTIIATTWGVIGDATAGEWSNSTPLTYDPASRTWKGAVTMKPGAFKFRANNAWDINYGSFNHDGKLDTKNDNNIPVTLGADYLITLDLSSPHAYTYSTLTWGLIGDATPGGWSTDTPMAWDATNKVWTATVALVSSGGAKSFKFRANQGWTLNLGGKGTGDGTADNYAADGFTASLAEGGKNLPVPGNVDGNYKVTLNPVTLIATIVKQ